LNAGLEFKSTPATNLFNHLHHLAKIARQWISFPCSVSARLVIESLLLMLLSCCPAAVCRPPAYCPGVWFFRAQISNDSWEFGHRNGASASAAHRSSYL